MTPEKKSDKSPRVAGEATLGVNLGHPQSPLPERGDSKNTQGPTWRQKTFVILGNVSWSREIHPTEIHRLY